MKDAIEPAGDDVRSKRKQRPLRSYYLTWTILKSAIVLDFILKYWLYRHK